MDTSRSPCVTDLLSFIYIYNIIFMYNCVHCIYIWVLHWLASSLCLLSTSKLVCGGRSGSVTSSRWMLHIGGGWGVSPLQCKALWVPRKALYKCNKLLFVLALFNIILTMNSDLLSCTTSIMMFLYCALQVLRSNCEHVSKYNYIVLSTQHISVYSACLQS